MGLKYKEERDLRPINLGWALAAQSSLGWRYFCGGFAASGGKRLALYSASERKLGRRSMRRRVLVVRG